MDETRAMKPTTVYAAIIHGFKSMSTKDHPSFSSSTAFPVPLIQSAATAAAAAAITQTCAHASTLI